MDKNKCKCGRNNNYWIAFCNRVLQTVIILFTHNVSSHKIDRIFSELPIILQGKQFNEHLLEGECLYLREISINVNKLLAVLLSVYSLFYTILCCCLFISLYPFLILMLLLYICLFIVNKPNIFVFKAVVVV